MKNQWQLNISLQDQSVYNQKDSKMLYHLIKQNFGSQASSVLPLKSKDRFILYKDPKVKMKLWTEHLFYNTSVLKYQ